MARDIAPEIVTCIRAWAAADPAASHPTLAQGRRALDPVLLPTLIAEVAEITAEQLLEVLDRPPAAPPAPGAPPGQADDKPVPFLGLELSQEQGRRAVAWLDDQAGLAEALGLSLESWSERLQQGMQATVERLRGGPLGGVAAQVGATIADGALAGATRGFTGAADPRTSAAAGLRGLLAARDFAKSGKPRS